VLILPKIFVLVTKRVIKLAQNAAQDTKKGSQNMLIKIALKNKGMEKLCENSVDLPCRSRLWVF